MGTSTQDDQRTSGDGAELTLGFIGLGNMGAPMAANLARAGRRLLVHDVAGTHERAPPGAALAEDNRAVARGADAILLSLPDGDAVRGVAEEITGCSAGPGALCIIDTSTVGIAAAREIHACLARAGIEYLDAPVSGGVSGARNGTVAVMFAGSDAAFAAYRPVLEDIAAHIVHVGREAGLGQAMKLLNNFLSAVAMTATSEAVALGERHGLDMATMIEVLNASSGRNSASADKFPNRILARNIRHGIHLTPAGEGSAPLSRSAGGGRWRSGAGAVDPRSVATYGRIRTERRHHPRLPLRERRALQSLIREVSHEMTKMLRDS